LHRASLQTHCQETQNPEAVPAVAATRMGGKTHDKGVYHKCPLNSTTALRAIASGGGAISRSRCGRVIAYPACVS